MDEDPGEDGNLERNGQHPVLPPSWGHLWIKEEEAKLLSSTFAAL